MSDLTIELYRKIAEANEQRVFEHWHASSIADCPRAHFLKRKGVEALETPGAGKMLRWQSGHVIEGSIRPYLEQLYPDILSNQRLTSEALDLTGEYDNYVPSLKRIIEVKSVHDFAMKKDKESKEMHLRDKQPYVSHELQNHSYVMLLRENGQEVEEIEYLYITLGGLMVSYRTPIKSKLIRNVNARLKVLNESWKNDTPPECICDEKHPLWKSTMQYCDYRSKEDGCCSLKLLSK